MNKYLLLGGAGVAVGLTYALRGKRTRTQSKRNSANANQDSAALDDAGTTNEMAVQIVRALRDNAFEGNDEKLAIALGRPATEIRSWFDSSLPVDSDGLIKARGLAEERNVDIPR
jgi:hypothetical protein